MAIEQKEPTNEDRVCRAGKILESYHRLTMQTLMKRNHANDKHLVTDVLADLQHWCADSEIDFEYCLYSSRMHYEAETE